jgi:hypothetical protein
MMKAMTCKLPSELKNMKTARTALYFVTATPLSGKVHYVRVTSQRVCGSAGNLAW